ncbi:MAG: DUF3108 domain-containing protein [Bryobacteraceae bacterium]|jgi:hypothetical protein
MRLCRLRFPWLALVAAVCAAPQAPEGVVRPLSASEVLSYRAEWRLIHAGSAQLTWASAEAGGRAGWAARLRVESAGLVSRFYRVSNDYSSLADSQLCLISSLLRASEGSRRRETSVVFDGAGHKASLTARDLVTNAVSTQEIDIRPCEHDVIGALYRLRAMRLEPGQSIEMPVSDGKRAVMVRVEAQERETIRTDAGAYQTIRYEAFLFNNVLYRRSGRLLVWLTDDSRRLPVQIRIRLPFYTIGTVTLQLQRDRRRP